MASWVGRLPGSSLLTNKALAIAVLLLGLLYVGNAWSPSSYAIPLRLMGAPGQGLVLGEPRPIRSDEYAVYTPLLSEVSFEPEQRADVAAALKAPDRLCDGYLLRARAAQTPRTVCVLAVNAAAARYGIVGRTPAEVDACRKLLASAATRTSPPSARALPERR